MAKSKFGMMRFEEDKLDYAGAFKTPPNHGVVVSVPVSYTHLTLTTIYSV